MAEKYSQISATEPQNEPMEVVPQSTGSSSDDQPKSATTLVSALSSVVEVI